MFIYNEIMVNGTKEIREFFGDNIVKFSKFTDFVTLNCEDFHIEVRADDYELGTIKVYDSLKDIFIGTKTIVVNGDVYRNFPLEYMVFFPYSSFSKNRCELTFYSKTNNNRIYMYIYR